jgi:hypothetical protein
VFGELLGTELQLLLHSGSRSPSLATLAACMAILA